MLIVFAGISAFMLLLLVMEDQPPSLGDYRICTMVWIETVRSGQMPLRIRAKGTVVETGPTFVRILAAVDDDEGAFFRVNQSAEMRANGQTAVGRLAEILGRRSDGMTEALFEFGFDAPERTPGAEAEITTDAGSLSETLYIGRPVVESMSHTYGELFRLEGLTGIAVRVPVRYGRIVGRFAEVVEGLKAGDQVILTDMSDVASFRRIRLD